MARRAIPVAALAAAAIPRRGPPPPLVQHGTKRLMTELYGSHVDHRACLPSNATKKKPPKPVFPIQKIYWRFLRGVQMLAGLARAGSLYAESIRDSPPARTMIYHLCWEEVGMDGLPPSGDR